MAVATNVADLVELVKFPQESGIALRTLRYWTYTNLNDFADDCVVRVRRKVYLDRSSVNEWLEGHRPPVRA